MTTYRILYASTTFKLLTTITLEDRTSKVFCYTKSGHINTHLANWLLAEACERLTIYPQRLCSSEQLCSSDCKDGRNFY